MGPIIFYIRVAKIYEHCSLSRSPGLGVVVAAAAHLRLRLGALAVAHDARRHACGRHADLIRAGVGLRLLPNGARILLELSDPSTSYFTERSSMILQGPVIPLALDECAAPKCLKHFPECPDAPKTFL